MGYTTWDSNAYRAVESVRSASGRSAFEHHENIQQRKVRAGCHHSLNPSGVVRESRDSEQHPESEAVGVLLDVTGSMKPVVEAIQKGLPELMDTLIGASVILHPQILFGAVGDLVCDLAPLQVGQFESGVEMNTHLGNIYIEGQGGPFGSESYEAGIAWFGLRTELDCNKKRGQKGHLVIIGDENPYTEVTISRLEGLIGKRDDDLRERFGSSISVERIIEETGKMYHIYFLIPTGASGGHDNDIYRRWVGLLGQRNVIRVSDPKVICEAIAAIIAREKGLLGADASNPDVLRKLGFDTKKARLIAQSFS